MKQPLCFGCKYFKQYQTITFQTPGVCQWEPKGRVPEWLQKWLDSTDRYHGPDRAISNVFPVLSCQAFEDKPND